MIPKVRQGFTLIELLVVITIIGILAAVLIASFTSGGESARCAQCLANMRNLATACQTYGAVTHRYPHAGSIEYMKIDESQGIGNAALSYHEEPGWLSWNSKGAYNNSPKSHQASSAWFTSLYSDDEDAVRHALTNGVLWKYVSGNTQTYLCPTHVNRKGMSKPHWSYLMNAYFGWDTSEGSEAEGENFSRVEYGHLARADRRLLFCEVPFAGIGSWQPEGGGSGTDCDCVLQCEQDDDDASGEKGANKGENGSRENIGFNHKSGRDMFANIVFADGHVEKLRLPKGGMSDQQLKDLSSWLCSGLDISFDGKEYKKLEK